MLLLGAVLLLAPPPAAAFPVGYLEGGVYWTYSRTLGCPSW
jgi:hypothetical protein